MASEMVLRFMAPLRHYQAEVTSQDDVIVVLDSPKIACGRSKARVDDVNAFLRCNVRAKPKATSIFWILSGNGTTLSNDEVIDDCWTVIRVRDRRRGAM